MLNRDVDNLPHGLTVLFLCEMWERFSYYGMRSLLLLYMVQALQMDVGHATRMYGLYTGLIYLTPTLGGYLADKYLGQRRAIIIGGLLMAFGHFLLMAQPMWAFVLALTFLVVGCGLFKPNVSVLVGRLYADDDPRRDRAFSIFYVGINLGAFISPLVCGTLGQRLGWHWGFGCAGVGMLFGLAVFICGQNALGEHGLLPAAPMVSAKNSMSEQKTSAASRILVDRMVVLIVLALFGQVIFWAVFEQAGTSMTLFAENSTDLALGTEGRLSIPSSWFQAANPLFITLLSPLLAQLWLVLARSAKEPRTPAKFAVGMIFVAFGFFVMARAGAVADTGVRVSPTWLLLAYFFNTVGELCISPTGLAAVTRLAPRDHSSAAMGAWLAAMALGNYAGGHLASFYSQLTHAHFFSIAACLALLSATLLALFIRPLTRRMHLDGVL